jgi:hypothetical protein
MVTVQNFPKDNNNNNNIQKQEGKTFNIMQIKRNFLKISMYLQNALAAVAHLAEGH